MTYSNRWTVYGQAEPEALAVRNKALAEAYTVRDMESLKLALLRKGLGCLRKG